MEALAATVIGLVAPYLVKGAEEFAKSAGKEAFDVVKALATRLGAWWIGEPVAAAAVENLAKDPARYGKLLTDLLATDLAKDANFAVELRKLVDALGPSVDVVQKMEIAHGVTGARIGEMVEGKVRVNQDIKNARNVTGVEIDKLGR